MKSSISLPVQHGDGTQTRDFIYVKDTADAFVRLSEVEKSKKQIINVARGREIQIKDLIKIIAEQMNYHGDIDIIPNPRLTDVHRHYANNEKLKSIIEFKPTDLEKAIGNVVEYYRKV
jgi:UDP-glucose 4-epimerase